ncbi:MAG: hypothetical protein QXL18_05150 [Candidatus Woesearchaeota archaeon]
MIIEMDKKTLDDIFSWELQTETTDKGKRVNVLFLGAGKNIIRKESLDDVIFDFLLCKEKQLEKVVK